MRILETPWEKRNLGVNGIEFYFDKSDEIVEERVLHDEHHNYQIAYVPVNNMNILWKLEKAGFEFFETRFRISANLKSLQLPGIFTRYIENLDYYKVSSEDDKEQIFDSIRNGVFDTDKIAVDPVFGSSISGQRYQLWLRDEIDKKTCDLYMVKKQDENIGFFSIKKISEKKADSFLAALFNKNLSGGLGFSVLYFPMMEAAKSGYKKIDSGVSSNNPDSVKLHLALGYQINEMQYVMVKHC